MSPEKSSPPTDASPPPAAKKTGWPVLASATLAAALLAAAGCTGAYPNAPAPQLRITNVAAITDSLQRAVTLPGDGVAAVEISNPGPATRIEEFRFVLMLGDSEYGSGRFNGNVLVNENGSRNFNVAIVSQYIPAVRMALNRVKPLRVSYYNIVFVDGNGQRRVEHWPAPPMR